MCFRFKVRVDGNSGEEEQSQNRAHYRADYRTFPCWRDRCFVLLRTH